MTSILSYIITWFPSIVCTPFVCHLKKKKKLLLSVFKTPPLLYSLLHLPDFCGLRYKRKENTNVVKSKYVWQMTRCCYPVTHSPSLRYIMLLRPGLFPGVLYLGNDLTLGYVNKRHQGNNNIAVSMSQVDMFTRAHKVSHTYIQLSYIRGSILNLLCVSCSTWTTIFWHYKRLRYQILSYFCFPSRWERTYFLPWMELCQPVLYVC